MKESPAAGSTFFGTFPSDRIPRAVKDVDVRFFIPNFYNFPHAAISVNYTGEFPECFEVTAESMNSPLRTILGKSVGSTNFDIK